MAGFEHRSTDPSATTFIEMPQHVDENSRLSKALSLHPDVLDYIVSLNPHDFQRLHNPLMRRLMPPRISLKRIAKITNRPVVDILARIHEIAGQPLSDDDRKEIAARAGLTAPDDEAPIREPPEWTSQEPKEVVYLLASDERLDSDPMVPIQQALKRCGPGEFILIKHKWEPQPLYDIWDKQGIQHFAAKQTSDLWWIFVRKPE